MSTGVRARGRSKSPRRSPRGRKPRASSGSAVVDTSSTAAASSSGVCVRVWHVMLLVVGGGSLAAWRAHYLAHGTLNPLYLAVSFFLVLNAFIAFCELNLHWRADYIRARHAQLEATYNHEAREHWRPALQYFMQPVTFSSLKSDTWADMWAAYTPFDPCYANDQTFGFWVDSGNGVLTLLPSLALLHNLTSDALSAALAPRYMAMAQALLFWTEWYGTAVYAWAFVYHGRVGAIGWRNLLLFVVLTNGLWAVLPLVGLYAMVGVIDSDSFDAFRK